MNIRSFVTSRTLLTLTLSAGALAACADSDDGGTTVTTYGDARVIRSDSGALTGPSSAARDAIVRTYLDARGISVDLHVTTTSASRSGLTHVTLEQQIDGLRIVGAYAKAAIDVDGRLVQVIDATVSAPSSIAKTVASDRDALTAAMAELGYEGATPAATTGNGNLRRFARGTDFHREPSVERIAYVDHGNVRAGFLVETWSVRGNQLDHTIVDATGHVVSVERRTNNDSYNVYVEDPGKGAQTVVNGPGGNVWLGAGAQTTNNITGNNAHAYRDADANNSPDAGGSAVTSGAFLTAADLTQSPTTAGNQAVAVQNLFYLNNVVHDALYAHGFDEAAGNFQANNFGLGGAGNDPVNAEAQDGSGTDNANFSTPADGSSPRMQMYLWTGTGPNAFYNVSSPAGISPVGAWASSFGAAPTTTGTATGALAYVGDGCGALSGLAGKIALVDRGTCDFTAKVLNAQTGGAIAVLIANNAPGDFGFGPGGTNRKVKIPSAMISNNSGNYLKGFASSGKLAKNPVTPLQIDGDIDADIVFHEYGHGLTWRMVGSMSGPISGAIGEGASDTVAFLLNGDDRIGEYAYGDPIGIRRAPYGAYTLTYADVTGAEVHNDGEIYAAAMWRVYQNYLAAGLTNSAMFDDFVGGLDRTPAAPSYEAMRDGMVAEATASGGTARGCLVWRGFASIGIGQGSSITLNHRGQVSGVTTSSTVPVACQ